MIKIFLYKNSILFTSKKLTVRFTKSLSFEDGRKKIFKINILRSYVKRNQNRIL